MNNTVENKDMYEIYLKYLDGINRASPDMVNTLLKFSQELERANNSSAVFTVEFRRRLVANLFSRISQMYDRTVATQMEIDINSQLVDIPTGRDDNAPFEETGEEPSDLNIEIVTDVSRFPGRRGPDLRPRDPRN